MLAIEADKSETTKGHGMESNQLDDKRVELTRKLSVNSQRSLANDTRQTAFKGNMRACVWASCGQRVALPCPFREEKTAISTGPLTKISAVSRVAAGPALTLQNGLTSAYCLRRKSALNWQECLSAQATKFLQIQLWCQHQGSVGRKALAVAGSLESGPKCQQTYYEVTSP